MKSERRHELQQNELADILGRFIKKAEPYAPVVLTAIIALVIAGLAFSYFQSRAATQRSDATLLYLLNSGQGDPAALGDIAASYPDTKAAQLAKLSQADAYLSQGIEAMFTDRELATADLQDALTTYQDVFDAAEEQIVRSRAAFGTARTHEALGEIDQAIESYQQVVEIHESDAIVEVAEQRIKSLQRADTKEFLAWFSEQKPQSADPSLPPGMPEFGGLPDFSAADDDFPQQPSSGAEPPSETEPPSEMTAPGDESDSEPAEPATADETDPPAADEPTDDAEVEFPADDDSADPASENVPEPADEASETK